MRSFWISLIISFVVGVALFSTISCVTPPAEIRSCTEVGTERVSYLAKTEGIGQMAIQAYEKGHAILLGNGVVVTRVDYIVYEGGPDLTASGRDIEFVFECRDSKGTISRVYSEKIQPEADLSRQ